VDRAADEYLATPVQSVASIFDFVYADVPPELAEQRETAVARSRGAA
jgi:hypothetical protein